MHLRARGVSPKTAGIEAGSPSFLECFAQRIQSESKHALILVKLGKMKQTIQIALIVAMMVAGIRLGWIFYERHEDRIQPEKKEAPPLNADYYVTPKKLYPYDLKTAKQLTQQPVWVKVGYVYPYYPYNAGARRADLAQESGKLLPLEKLVVNDVVAQSAPGKPGERQILAVFEENGKQFATPVGTEKGGDYQFYSDDMLFIQDPHELYKHWPQDVWQAIDQHQVKPGMSELQADFAIGIGVLESGSDEIDRTLDYPNGGNPLTVSFHEGKVVEIKPGKAG
jgi:hypothetical protein